MTEFDDIFAHPLTAFVYAYAALAFLALYTGAKWVLHRPRRAEVRLPNSRLLGRRV